MRTINIPAGTDFLTIDETGLVTFYKRVDHVIICDQGNPPTLLVFYKGHWVYIAKS